jgi:hypothetical protein
MNVTFIANRTRTKTQLVEIDDARIIFPHFSGEPDEYHARGERDFHLVIPNEEIKEMFMNDVNEWGVPWNVKINAPKDPDDMPFMKLKVKVKMEGKYPPVIRLVTRGREQILDETTIKNLDKIRIKHVDLDIRPYDDISKLGGKPFRTAYLVEMRVEQEVSRFDRRFAEEEYPEE